MRLSGSHPDFVFEWPGLLAAFGHQEEQRQTVRFVVPPSIASGFESLVLSPAVGALSTLSGNLVLHGSAVELDGEATVVLAEAGGGKSSVTALLCHAGARILSEDVCALTKFEDSDFRCFSGIHELRLRTTNLWLADLSDLVRSTPHADGRVVLRPRPSTLAACPVKTIAVIRLDRSAQEVSINTISATRATALLMSFQRTPVVSSHPLAIQMFDQAAQIASQVRMVVVTVPWSEANRSSRLGSELLQQLISG
jgi:hypothetical protein